MINVHYYYKLKNCNPLVIPSPCFLWGFLLETLKKRKQKGDLVDELIQGTILAGHEYATVGSAGNGGDEGAVGGDGVQWLRQQVHLTHSWVPRSAWGVITHNASEHNIQAHLNCSTAPHP